MKRILVIFVIITGIATASCNRSSCPAYQENTDKMKLEDNGKSSSGALPKGKN
jgi:hypothetical protein